MKKIRALGKIIKITNMDKLIYGYIFFFLVISVLVMLAEPSINTYRDSLWYCYSMAVTIGFGDLVAVTAVGRILSVVLSLYTLLLIGMIPGVVVTYYNEIQRLRQKETVMDFMEKLEHLEELSKEELADISARVRKKTAL